MLLRPFLNDAGSCASYLFGCTSHLKLAVVDPHGDLVEDYVSAADAIGSPIVAVFETHVQADHLSGLPLLVARTGAAAFLPEGAGVAFDQLRSVTATLSSSGTRSSRRSRRQAMRPPTTRTRSPIVAEGAASRGSCSAVTRC